ncbi:MAG TPA: hypothetical protein VF577_00675 [Allosphingosinicella sp.]|jgi:hypothetical protein
MRLVAAAALLATACMAFPGCSVRRTLDQATFDEIKTACRLSGSRLIRQNGRNTIDIHTADETEEKLACIERQLRDRNITMHLNFGDLGAPDVPPDVQECTRQTIEERGAGRLTDLSNIHDECVRAFEARK